MGRSESDTDTGTPPAASTGLSPRDVGSLFQQSGDKADLGKVNRSLLGYLGLCIRNSRDWDTGSQGLTPFTLFAAYGETT